VPILKSTPEIKDEVRRLQRARVICATLREEKLLARSPYMLLHLAKHLLGSLRSN
jgi:hypothetical protein